MFLGALDEEIQTLLEYIIYQSIIQAPFAAENASVKSILVWARGHTIYDNIYLTKPFSAILESNDS